MSSYQEKYQEYLEIIRRPFLKCCRMRFLNPDGSTAFAIDSNSDNPLNSALIGTGNLSVNLQNGQRRSLSVTFENVTEKFSYNVNNLWFGQEIALDEGVILSDGSEFYLPQGVFLLTSPEETLQSNENSVSYNLVDKWANLDGSLGGNLEGTYVVDVGTNIFAGITALLAEVKSNGRPVDNTPPVYTVYYNDKTQELPDGTTVSLLDSPYTLEVDGGSTKADVILGLAEMINGWVGYDPTGALRIDASQDDIDDSTKPVDYAFSLDEAQLMGLTYQVNNEAVYNDYIVMGEGLDDYAQPAARARNFDPASDTNINIIGEKTYWESKNGYATETQCADYAVWKLKRAAVLQKAVTVTCTQIFHIHENNLITIARTDKEGAPIERHVIQGFSRPLVGTETMTINCISVNDFPNVTVTKFSETI